MITIYDIAPLFTVRRKTTIGGHPFSEGNCPVCGGTTRAGYYEVEDSKGQVRARWFCRHCNEKHPQRADPRFWWADYLLFLVTGKWPEGDYKPGELPGQPRGQYERKPVPAPVFDELTAKHPRDTTLAQIAAYALNTEPTLRYFGSYRLTARTVARFQLGYAPQGVPHCSIPGGWTIPNISLGANGIQLLRGVQVRRDEAVCLAKLKLRNPHWVEWRKRELVDKWLKDVEAGRRDEVHVPTELDLIEDLWPKYGSIAGSQSGIWGDDLVSLPGGERRGPDLPYCIVCEDAKSAMVLRQDGYPAVAYTRRLDWDAHLGDVFGAVRKVIVVADRDEKLNNLGTGMNKAVHVRECILTGRRGNDVTILLPPAPYNDVADLVKVEGFLEMRRWLKHSAPNLETVLERDAADDRWD